MKTDIFSFEGMDIPVRELDTIVIGSGCAGYNAADWLYTLGHRDIAIVTEGRNMGTSRNTGSDKQTYYKLSLAADGPDSVEEMARTLYDGGSVHGDTALTEAACSAKCFFKLANLGVPFPTNSYGEYVGYKTDHDPRQRATSAGPLTSKFMTECLERSVMEKGISIHDNIAVISILVSDKRIVGALALDKNDCENDRRGLILYRCKNIIAASGGPAAVYATSVYPESQTGMSGMLLAAGTKGANMQDWQFGLASTKFRWNVSGTYQQVLPRFIAVDNEGNEREFLNDYFDDPLQAVDMVFLKGYQWPFDTRKIQGSSLVDILVHHEIFVKGNRVYMDFTRNPSCIDDAGFDGLSDETRKYLENSNALFGTPIQRLQKMNQPAIDLYKNHDIDITVEPLEVSVCAQHCNGGIAVDADWQTCVRGLYVAGEAAGTFGTYRPGGSALNSTQVGSMRAAEHIAYDADTDFGEGFETTAAEAVSRFADTVKELNFDTEGKISPLEALGQTQKLMSMCAAHIRDPQAVGETAAKLLELLKKGSCIIKGSDHTDLLWYYKYEDTLKTQLAVLSAIELSARTYGSRGSGMVKDEKGNPIPGNLEEYRYRAAICPDKNYVLTTDYNKGECSSYLVEAKAIPQRASWFENVWNDYMQRTSKGR